MTAMIPITAIIKDPKRVATEVQKGKSFTVLSHSKPLFKIVPLDSNADSDATKQLFADFLDFMQQREEEKDNLAWSTMGAKQIADWATEDGDSDSHSIVNQSKLKPTPPLH
ncbi:MAG: hypothetical protein WCP97_09675 [bacterium]